MCGVLGDFKYRIEFCSEYDIHRNRIVEKIAKIAGIYFERVNLCDVRSVRGLQLSIVALLVRLLV